MAILSTNTVNNTPELLAAASINGGSRINHQALADIMPSLRDVDAIVSSLRAMASDLGIAA